MSSHSDLPLPQLRTASSEVIDEVCKEYKTGASYQGALCNNKKVGRGVFKWPNGAKYDGEFMDNARHGKGLQVWADGTEYEGDFHDDLRHGEGSIKWANGESYEGTFFKDRRHGRGKYCWPDGSTYEGTFYMDKKEGYGEFTFANKNVFQGLYKEDEREGPGVLTYPDQKQDVGLWHREKLVRLCGSMQGAFTMKEHEEFSFYPEEHRVYIQNDGVGNRTDVVDNIINPPEEFQYGNDPDLGDQSQNIFNDTLDSKSLAVDIQSFDAEFFKAASPKNSTTEIKSNLKDSSVKKRESSAKSNKSAGTRNESAKSERQSSAKSNQSKPGSAKSTQSKPGSAKSPPGSAKSKPESAKSSRIQSANSSKGETIERPESCGVVAWNNTPSCIAMQQHILRHQYAQPNAGFDVDKVIDGDRSDFGEKGQIETDSEQFIDCAMEGDLETVASLLSANKVYVDVTDVNGNSALLGAGVNWHQEVINCLLDNGADINRLNNEGISTLAACHVFFYPIDRFKYNIAEKYLEPPPDLEKEEGYDVNEAVKSILNSSGKTRKPTTTEKTAALNNPNAKKIQELREEYKLKEEKNKNNIKNRSAFSRGGEEGDGETAERKLGTIKVQRSVKINVEDILTVDPPPAETPWGRGKREKEGDSDDESVVSNTTSVNDFESARSVRNFPIEVTDQLIERCATGLSTNTMVVDRARSAKSDKASIGTVRRLAMEKSHHKLMEDTIRLLLKRGADPNASNVPMPILFFAIKAADVDAVRLLLMKGASTETHLSDKRGGLAPLHIACAIPGEEGVQITELLLNSLADPDVRAALDDSFLNRALEDEWSKDPITDEARAISGGRTPLHIATARDDNYKNACRVVHLLLEHHANPNLLCNGHSPLALAIRSGNDLAIDELLSHGANTCLPLTHGVGSALCMASSTEYEHRRNPEDRLKLIDKLVRAGADILAPIPIGAKRVAGTAVDYAYYMYNLDRRIAHMPYHALTHAERETFNARRRLLAHMGDILRVKAVEREKAKLEEEAAEGRSSRSPSPNFVYTGAGAPLPSGIIKVKGGRAFTDSKVSFGKQEGEVRKPTFRYCYECGRSVGVRLSACTRCKEVYYCSKACKLKAWNARHKEECIRIGGGRSPSPSTKDKRIDSPTPTTDPDRGKPHTVKGIMDSKDPRVKSADLRQLPPIDNSKQGIFMKGGATSDDEDGWGDDETDFGGNHFGGNHENRKGNQKRSKGKNNEFEEDFDNRGKNRSKRGLNYNDFQNGGKNDTTRNGYNEHGGKNGANRNGFNENGGRYSDDEHARGNDRARQRKGHGRYGNETQNYKGQGRHGNEAQNYKGQGRHGNTAQNYKNLQGSKGGRSKSATKWDPNLQKTAPRWDANLPKNAYVGNYSFV